MISNDSNIVKQGRAGKRSRRARKRNGKQKGATSVKGGQTPRAVPKSRPKTSPLVSKVKARKNKTLKKEKVVKAKQQAKSVTKVVTKPSFRKNRAFLTNNLLGCLPSATTTIPLTFNQSWLKILNVIDKTLAALQIDKPDLFLRPQNGSDPSYAGGTGPPLVPFVAARAAILLGVMEYFNHLHMINQLSLQNIQSTVGIKIPIGVAKFVQQYAPYYDEYTGAMYSFQIPSLMTDTMLVYPNYPDISAASSSFDPNIATNFNAVYETALIHPSQYVTSSASAVDYKISGTGSKDPTYPFVSTGPVSLSNYVASLSSLVKDNINRSCASIYPLEIGDFAPDASFYAQVSSQCVSCITSDFDHVIACLGPGNLADGSQSDNGMAYPYNRGLPAFNCSKVAGSYYTQTARLRLFNNVFATMMLKVTVYEKDLTPIECMRHTKCFSEVTSFEFSGIGLSTVMIVERLAEYMAVLSNNNAQSFGTTDATSNSPTNLFGLTVSYWSAILRRAAPWDQMLDITDQYWGYAQGGGSVDVRLPDLLSHIVSSVGPIVVDGKLVVPYFFTMPNEWDLLIDNAGVWNPDIALLTDFRNGVCGYAPFVGSVLDMTIRTDIGHAYQKNAGVVTPVKSTLGPVLISEWFSETMKNLPGENWSLASPLNDVCYSTVNKMLGFSTVRLSLGRYGAIDSIVGQYERLFKITFGSAVANTCANLFDGAEIGICGLLSSLTISTGNHLRSQTGQFKLQPNSQLKNLSTQISLTSTFTGTLQAIEQAKNRKTKMASVYEGKQYNLVKLLEQAADQIFDTDILNNGIAVDKFKEGRRHRQSGIKIRVVGQSSLGKQVTTAREFQPKNGRWDPGTKGSMVKREL